MSTPNKSGGERLAESESLSEIQPTLWHTFSHVGAVAGVVGIEVGVVSGVFNLESSGVDALDWRPRHEEH
jgi:hypothetical protein